MRIRDIVLPGMLGAGLSVAADTRCGNLVKLAIPNTSVTEAAGSARGAVTFCKAIAVARPVEDSEIQIEVWMPPPESWNGKFVGTGNGGYSGALSYGQMEAAVKDGYSVAGSNTGHSGSDLQFGVGHPEKIQDWGYRAVHVMTETAKLLIHAYYGRFPAWSFFSGCSTGGHQALMEAQRYPADYDGILAGAPGNNRVRLNVGFLWSWTALHKDRPNPLPASKLPLLTKAVIAACDMADGLKDGLIGDPRRCAFEPGTLLCEGPDAADCLTAPQVESVRKIYDGARNPRTGERLFAGWPKGSEAGWGAYFVGRPQPARTEFWRDWVFHDPDWSPLSFDFDRDVTYADEKMAFLVANDSDLSAFRLRKGKLLVYHGWADPVAPPEDSIRYYESVAARMGGLARIAPFFRLFLAPGMGHCAGGAGPSRFDALAALDRWVTQGKAPDRMDASHLTGGQVDRTRPLCPYPLVARWSGRGSIDDAAQFSCLAATAPPAARKRGQE
jgi:feruloyl esterase